MSAVLTPPVTSPVVKPARTPIAVTNILPSALNPSDYYHFSVADFERMVEQGILSSETPVELINGLVVSKMPRNPIHDGTLDLLEGILLQLIPTGWFIRTQRTVHLSNESSLEPDIAIVRGDRKAYLNHHPRAAEIGLIVEIANSSLKYDLETKAAVYAEAGIPLYWVVNLIDRHVVVFSDPSPAVAGTAAHYRQQKNVTIGEVISLVLDGQTVSTFDVGSFLV